jgi:hypothetical protein
MLAHDETERNMNVDMVFNRHMVVSAGGSIIV